MTDEITILSGKGGTGKTSVTAALAALAGNVLVTDCDVDAADLHLLLNPEIMEKQIFEGAWTASIDRAACSGCGICREVCRFDAVSHAGSGAFRIDPFKCEGCRLCERICPEKAITSTRSVNNFLYVSKTRYGTLVHAHMGPGEENSGKLVTAVRKRANDLATENRIPLILNDGPPGIGCPVIASVSGVKKALLVVEPSKSGLHDISRLAGLIQKFEIRAFAIINKHDLNPAMTTKTMEILRERNIPVLGKITFDENFTQAMIQGKTITEFAPDSENVKTLRRVLSQLSQRKDPNLSGAEHL